MTQSKLELLEELSQLPINVLRVRAICRENPGIIEGAGLRLRVWNLLLLDSSQPQDSAFLENAMQPCLEQHVLEADVRRTRATLEEFRSDPYQKAITCILQTFCLRHGVQYKQGMNEILAPFLHLVSPLVETAVTFKLFDAFLFRYSERFVFQDDDEYLFKSFRMFQILLTYHDPQLAIHLESQGFPPELYSPQWFLTLYARSLPLNAVLRLWDLIIAWDDCAFMFFIGVCLIRRRRHALLLAHTDSIPEILSTMLIHEAEIDSLVAEAIVLYKSTPRCFCRCLRLCCVSSTELTPLPSHARVRSHDHVHDSTLAAQAVRSCLMMTPQELISTLLPLATDESMQQAMQFVVLDVRSSADVECCGGGTIPRAIRIEPDFLTNPESLDKWMDHFDGTRGCNIVIVDLPPVHASSNALWRRLLLGEGDGVHSSLVRYNSAKNVASISSLFAPFVPKVSLKEEEFNGDEKRALIDDSTRPAVFLAKALQKSNFNLVSVLDGGYPALVDQLLLSRGSVEPVVVDFDLQLWKEFMQSTGRAEAMESQKKARQSAAATFPEKNRSSSIGKVLTEEQRLLVALKVALRLEHKHTENILRKMLQDKGVDVPMPCHSIDTVDNSVVVGLL